MVRSQAENSNNANVYVANIRNTDSNVYISNIGSNNMTDPVVVAFNSLLNHTAVDVYCACSAYGLTIEYCNSLYVGECRFVCDNSECSLRVRNMVIDIASLLESAVHNTLSDEWCLILKILKDKCIYDASSDINVVYSILDMCILYNKLIDELDKQVHQQLQIIEGSFHSKLRKLQAYNNLKSLKDKIKRYTDLLKRYNSHIKKIVDNYLNVVNLNIISSFISFINKYAPELTRKSDYVCAKLISINDEINEKTTMYQGMRCDICMDNDKECVPLPCGHIKHALCMDCYTNIMHNVALNQKQCPTCRSPITDFRSLTEKEQLELCDTNE